MTRPLTIAALLLVTLTIGSSQGLAASLPVTTRPFWSGFSPISTCDRDGISVSYNTTALLTITSVTVGKIADLSSTSGAGACDGRTVKVVLLGSGGSPIAGAEGSRTIAGDSNTTDDTVTVSLAVPPLTLSVTRARITIT